jgi:D-alanyl-D-alanine carboxypeptidase
MKRAFVATVLTLSCAVVQAQTLSGSDLSERLDVIAKMALSRPVAGISVAVARDGKVVFARGYGLANLEHAVAVTPNTVFHIASISKNILAAVVLQLADEGKLRLDDDVTKYVPEAPTHGRHITVRQLLNQTSGIYSFTSLPEAENNERLDLTHDQIIGLIKDKPLDFEPGTSWRYDNSAFYLAGMVVESVTKQEYGQYVHEHLFTPLGMSSASLCDARMVVPHLASGYEVDHGKFVNAPLMSWKLPFAAGAVCATAEDLLKWQAALDAGRVLSASSLRLMRTPTILEDGTPIDYGFGTRLGSMDGHRVFGHTGGGGGFNSLLESFPDDHLTIVVLMNARSGAGPSLALGAAIARAMLGLPEKKTLLDLPVPKEELAALVGNYDSDEGPVEIFARNFAQSSNRPEGEDAKLRYRLPGSAIEGVLLRQAANIYALDENSEVHFLVRNGRSTWTVVYSAGLMMDPKPRVLTRTTEVFKPGDDNGTRRAMKFFGRLRSATYRQIQNREL